MGDSPICDACGAPCGLGLIRRKGLTFCGKTCEERQRNEKGDTPNTGLLLLVGIACVLLYGAVLVLMSAVAKADHTTVHRVLSVGKPTRGDIRLLSCPDVNDAMKVVISHERDGIDEAYETIRALRRIGRCQILEGKIIVEETLWSKRLPFRDGLDQVSVIRFSFDGDRRSFFSPLKGFTIREKDGET